MRNRHLAIALILGAGFVLSGCDEAADDDTTGDSPPMMEDPVTDPTPPAPELSTINKTNAGALASNAFEGLDTAGGSAGAMNFNGLALACDNAGSLTPTGTGLNDLMLSVGENFGMDFVDCLLGELLLDGSVTYTATAITGVFLDLSADWSVTFDVTFTNFTATQGMQVEMLNDTFSLDWSFNATTFETTVTQGTETLVLTGGTLVFNDLSYEEIGGNYTLTFDATFSADGIGDLQVTTPQPLVGPVLGVPESGQVLVAADDGSTLLLTFTGGGAVTVALDEDDDTVIDCSQDLTFDTLDQFDPDAC